ncbi:hypothetical protein PILCRDRAFT_758847 [Piloderma croceum F 1598]|uniref:Uncharacterized protein n=1 Tax=Piloderma croceum (strain F 1598) TaxID=765440 RepID=A0A0C3ETT9_PILCF|nr:hypothetical protein PILCRDRAFT_758847 [Piloderma croceum F 1598]
MWWGHKADGEVIYHAGTSNFPLPPIRMGSCLIPPRFQPTDSPNHDLDDTDPQLAYLICWSRHVVQHVSIVRVDVRIAG